jgi:hypothetical protein
MEVLSMKHEEIISQVKEEYSNIINDKSQQHFDKTSDDIVAKDYYQNLQEAVIFEIKSGKFNNCKTGKEIVDSVAANKTLLSNWK